jgi:hypothetical protein
LTTVCWRRTRRGSSAQLAENAAGFTNRLANGRDSCSFVRGVLGDIRRSASPPARSQVNGRGRVRLAQILELLECVFFWQD